jgi:tetratricopeptide (TPR) repeat protein
MRLIALVLGCLVAFGPALADAKPRAPRRPADVHLAAAHKARQLGEYELALIELHAAWFRAPRPRLLWEMAEVNRAARNFERARFFYQRYLEQAPAAERPDVAHLLAIVEHALKAEEEARVAEPVDVLALSFD